MIRRTSSISPRSATIISTGTPVSDAIRAATAVAFLAPAPDDGDARRARLGKEPRDGRAEALRAPRDHRDLSVDPVHCTTSYPASAITRISSSCPFFAISSGGETFGSCSASTTNQPS